MTEIELYKEALLKWLRDETKTCRQAAKLERKQAELTTDIEAWDLARLLDGSAIAYEDVIKHVRGLRECEYQLEKKRGTL